MTLKKLSALALLAAALAWPLGGSSALAQRRSGPNDSPAMTDAAPTTNQKGDPLYGYFLTAALGAAAVFAACKSARR